MQPLCLSAAMRKQVVVQNVGGEFSFFSRTRLLVHVHRGVHHVARHDFERLLLREHRVRVND